MTETLPPGRYSKRDILYLLADPTVDLANPGKVKPIAPQTLHRWIKRKGDAFYANIGITEQEYKQVRTFSSIKAMLILAEF